MPEESVIDERASKKSSKRARPKSPSPIKPGFLDFFAGSGLVTEALKPSFEAVWANDICERKGVVYRANHSPKVFHSTPIEEVKGWEVPNATLSWASFPCQDLSLAGNMDGIKSARSGLVWQWLRVMDEMGERPPIVVAENVVGLVSASGGAHYRSLHGALSKRGYRCGAVILDAALWAPQSRPRVFVVGVSSVVNAEGFEDKNPGWAQPASIQKAVHGLRNKVWWRIPEPKSERPSLEELIDFTAPLDPPHVAQRNIGLIPKRHMEKLEIAISEGRRAFPGYRRTRDGKQTLELRFDGVAGCLRTPEGGSSRQLLVIHGENGLGTRLLTMREAAALMGAGPDYKIPGSYNSGYKAMGDAVAVPAARHLAESLLAPLARHIEEHG